MADVFISYDSADKERVRSLVAELEAHGWTVWWDRRIPPGRTFAEVIYEAIEAARCMIVIWSSASIDSRWVRREAAEGDRRGILLPVLFDEVELPFEFRDIHAAGLVGYPHTVHRTEIEELLAAVGGLAPASGSEGGVLEKAPVAEEQAAAPGVKGADSTSLLERKGKALLLVALGLLFVAAWIVWTVRGSARDGEPTDLAVEEGTSEVTDHMAISEPGDYAILDVSPDGMARVANLIAGGRLVDELGTIRYSQIGVTQESSLHADAVLEPGDLLFSVSSRATAFLKCRLGPDANLTLVAPFRGVIDAQSCYTIVQGSVEVLTDELFELRTEGVILGTRG